MMDFNERVIPNTSSNFMYREALARYVFLKKFVKKSDKVVDLGCGTGYGSFLISKYVKSVVGVDINHEAINYARSNYRAKNLEFKIGDIYTTSQVKHVYDVVCMFEVVEHLSNPTIILKKIKNVLTENGVFIISTPNANFSSPDGKIVTKYHFKEYKYNEFLELLSTVFKDVALYGQNKSTKAKKAWRDFMHSQDIRQKFVNVDSVGIRRLFPKSVKEKMWKFFGRYVGRGTQDLLDVKDFPIKLDNAQNADYFIAVCKK